MRKRICLLIIFVILMIVLVHVSDKGYRPLYKLTADDVASIAVTYEDGSIEKFENREELDPMIHIINGIEIRFTGIHESKCLLNLDISLCDNTSISMEFYENSIAIDGKPYTMTKGTVYAIIDSIK